MILELQEPFKSLWNKGYLRLSNDNRKRVDLVNNELNRTTISYARYLMCVKLGYILSEEYEVDHIDDDKTNDDINNLQVLTQEQNLLKKQYKYIIEDQVCFGYECKWCDTKFILTEREKKMRLAQNVEFSFCSKTCSSKYHSFSGNLFLCKSIDKEEQIKIKELRNSGLSSYKISEITGFARNTVMKYW